MGRGQTFFSLNGGKGKDMGVVWDVDGWSLFLEVILFEFFWREISVGVLIRGGLWGFIVCYMVGVKIRTR